MKRREFITLLGTAAAWPLAARAQQPDRVRRIGLVMGLPNDSEAQARIMAFRQNLETLGWKEGHNIQIDYRFAAGNVARAQHYVSELVNSAPDVIVGQSTPVIAALKQATSTIPIVFAVVNDPVGQGFVESLAHPGRNITGFTFIEFIIVGKWLELLKETAPGIRRAALMFNPETAPFYPIYLSQLTAAPAKLPAQVAPAPVKSVADIEATIAGAARESGGALIVAADSFTNAHRSLITTLVTRHRLPAAYGFRQFIVEGGLISYGPDAVDISRRSAEYVDRILKGAKPADLPVQQPTKFELVINLKTAKALGLDVPPTLLARADEVIE